MLPCDAAVLSKCKFMFFPQLICNFCVKILFCLVQFMQHLFYCMMMSLPERASALKT